MGEGKIIKIQNGDQLIDYKIYECCLCKKVIGESDAFYEGKGKILCLDCSFKQGLISEGFYLKYSLGVDNDKFHVGVNPKNKKIEIWIGKCKTPPWEMSNKEIRNSKEYIEWRNAVFKRDNWTCQKCGKRGITINAHHIKPFAKYKNLRFVLENGITLCEKCHKKIHKET
ncbi:HNH endonuclease [Clostridium felsineum]|uniref:HNH endonuclease n=1 Tax=Clostridium felsineum TaxID=36839 RepID=UPI00214D3136|nr:HNH endonuclease [Clostridium felsineum]MCR3760388.1 HNH endonuclease [Clostridium felsineum]